MDAITEPVADLRRVSDVPPYHGQKTSEGNFTGRAVDEKLHELSAAIVQAIGIERFPHRLYRNYSLPLPMANGEVLHTNGTCWDYVHEKEMRSFGASFHTSFPLDENLKFELSPSYRAPLGGIEFHRYLTAHFAHGAGQVGMTLAEYAHAIATDDAFRNSQISWLTLPVNDQNSRAGTGTSSLFSFVMSPGLFDLARPQLEKIMAEKEREGVFELSAVCAGCGPRAMQAYAYTLFLDRFVRELAEKRHPADDNAREEGSLSDEALAWYGRWKIKMYAQSIDIECLREASDCTLHFLTRSQRELADRFDRAEMRHLSIVPRTTILDNHKETSAVAWEIPPRILDSVSLEWTDLLNPVVAARRNDVDLFICTRTLYLQNHFSLDGGRSGALESIIDSLKVGGILITDANPQTRFSELRRHAAEHGTESIAGYPLYFKHDRLTEIRSNPLMGINEGKAFFTSTELANKDKQFAYPNISAYQSSDAREFGFGDEIDAEGGRAQWGVFLKVR